MSITSTAAAHVCHALVVENEPQGSWTTFKLSTKICQPSGQVTHQKKKNTPPRLPIRISQPLHKPLSPPTRARGINIPSMPCSSRHLSHQISTAATMTKIDLRKLTMQLFLEILQLHRIVGTRQRPVFELNLLSTGQGNRDITSSTCELLQHVAMLHGHIHLESRIAQRQVR